jgi:hypothetical protein
MLPWPATGKAARTEEKSVTVEDMELLLSHEYA